MVEASLNYNCFPKPLVEASLNYIDLPYFGCVYIEGLFLVLFESFSDKLLLTLFLIVTQVKNLPYQEKHRLLLGTMTHDFPTTTIYNNSTNILPRLFMMFTTNT